MAELHKEIAEYDDFLLLDIEDEYSKLPYKTLAFFKATYALYDPEFYVKADDDIYLRPDVLSSLVALRNNRFRMFSNEDVTIGSWMLAMNVYHEDNKKLCQAECTPSSIAV